MAGLTVADASALIAYLDAGDAHHREAIEGLAEVDRFVVHPITLCEVLVHPVREDNEVAVVNVLTTIGMVESSMTIDPVALARVRVETGLKLPDCLVIATARWHQVGVLTFDDRLRAAAAHL